MREFLVVYDYGTGGVWGIATAASEQQISKMLPELQVVLERPGWMDDEAMRAIRDTSAFIAGDDSTYPIWLRTLVDSR